MLAVVLLIIALVVFFFVLPKMSHDIIAKTAMGPVTLHERHGGHICLNADWGLYYNRVRAAGDDPDDVLQAYFFRGADQVTRYSLMRKHYLKHGMNWRHHPDPSIDSIPAPAKHQNEVEIPIFLKKKT